ncbi:B3 domain-containing protein [Quillaja saponaria]|uniref:B3 domain-containing protein n=1 Tax=Quillaja saponaria TaxID=32244 RepID=A0AAD7KRH5_QUISA|nr:B3 domain-containing protein [Quillaja saponaria]
MEQVRERCRMLEKQKYWTEVESNRHFFKVMIGNFRNHLRIPRKFVTSIEERLSPTFSLIGPSGHAWKVELRRRVDDVLFQKGWGEFVQDHSLAETDFLVFRYCGDSSFSVLIFDATGCEREDAYFVQMHTSCSKNGCFLQKKGRENVVEVIDLVNEEDTSHRGKLKRVGSRTSKAVGMIRTNFETEKKKAGTRQVISLIRI